MPNTTEMGQAALPTWRGAIADRVAPPAARRTPLSEDQARAAVGAVFFALAAFYVVSTIVRIARGAR
ncbi:MAG TPA: hypothetical protein VNO82_00020 [Solirubrobacteraceae bacterium]|nr:hypothetical protein [Solirubrobacteraceae bacterium]